MLTFNLFLYRLFLESAAIRLKIGHSKLIYYFVPCVFTYLLLFFPMIYLLRVQISYPFLTVCFYLLFLFFFLFLFFYILYCCWTCYGLLTYIYSLLLTVPYPYLINVLSLYIVSILYHFIIYLPIIYIIIFDIYAHTTL